MSAGLATGRWRWGGVEQPLARRSACHRCRHRLLSCSTQPVPARTPVLLATGTAWWRDGGGNFTVPVPGPRHKHEGGSAHGMDDDLRCALLRQGLSGAGPHRRLGRSAGVQAVLGQGCGEVRGRLLGSRPCSCCTLSCAIYVADHSASSKLAHAPAQNLPGSLFLQPHHCGLRGQHRRLDAHAPLQQGLGPAGGCHVGACAWACTATERLHECNAATTQLCMTAPRKHLARAAACPCLVSHLPHTGHACCPPTRGVQGRWQDVDGALARIYVWLRYSAIRQLTWQRNYNTQVCGVTGTQAQHAWRARIPRGLHPLKRVAQARAAGVAPVCQAQTHGSARPPPCSPASWAALRSG